MRSSLPSIFLTICMLLLVSVMVTWAGSYGTFRFTTHRGNILTVVATDMRSQQHLQAIKEGGSLHQAIVPALNSPNPKLRWGGFEVVDYDKPSRWDGNKWITVPVVVVAVPFWPVAAVLMAVTLLSLLYARRQRSRAKVGHCTACGYDLRGIASDRCPECGRLIPDRPAVVETSAAADGAAERIRPDRPVPQPRLQ